MSVFSVTSGAGISAISQLAHKRNEKLNSKAQTTNSDQSSPTSKTESTSGKFEDLEESSHLKYLVNDFVKMDFFVPRHYTCLIDNEYSCYDLNIFQRIFLTFQDSNSSISSFLVNLSIVCTIGLSVYATIMGDFYRNFSDIPTTCPDPACYNDPQLCPGRMMCEPNNNDDVSAVNDACLYIFTIDLAIRMCLVPFIPTNISGLYNSDWGFMELQQVNEAK